jgi:quercetin dioxygenase-like cupin family protein
MLIHGFFGNVHTFGGNAVLKKSLLIVALLGLTLSGAAYAQQAPSPVQPSPVKRTIIGKVDVPGSNTEVITAVVELQPGFKAGRHTHPGTVQAYILDGEFMLAADGQPVKTFTVGQSLEVPNGMIHNEGSVGDKPVKFIGIYVVEKGKPLVQPVQ